MASNSRRRSSSSGSRTTSSRNRVSTRPTSVKGRPSQGRTLRSSQRSGYASASSSRPSARRPAQASTRRPSSGGGARSVHGGSAYRQGGGRYQNGDLRSVSVSEVRNASRYSKARTGSSRKVMGVFVTIAVLLGVFGIGGFVLSNSGAFAVEQVTVSGADHLSSDELTELAAVPAGSTLLNVDANGIATRLATNPWVKSVSVDRVFPNTLNLNISERSISAVVAVTVDSSNTVERWALSSDGMWLTKIPDDRNSAEGKALPDSVYNDADNALEITDIPYGSTPEAGSYCNNSNVENALGVIDGMTTELAGQVKSVAAASSDSTTLTLQNGIEIAFGDSNDIRDKERVCLQLMKEHEGKISYINVRVVNKPDWRSV